MFGLKVWLAACLLAIAGAPAVAAPLESYGKLPQIEEVEISPDGANLAMTVTNGEQRRILIERISDETIIGGVNAGDAKVRWLQWAGPNHVLITTSSTTGIEDVMGGHGEWYMTLDYDVVRKVQRPTMTNVRESLNVVVSSPQIRIIGGHPMAFMGGVHFVEGRGQISLFKVDLDRGVTSLVSEGFTNTHAWVVGDDGQPLAESEFDSKSLKWTLRAWRDKAWKVIHVSEGSIEHPELVGLGRDGRTVLIRSEVDERDVYRELPPGADDWSAPFADMEERSGIYDPASDLLIGTFALVGDEARYAFFKPADQVAWDAVVKAYPNDEVSLVSASADHRKFVVLADSPVDGPAYALVDLDSRSGKWIGGEYAGIDAASVSPVKPIAFKAADGTALTGYLTLPQGKAAKDLPLIVFPHGGPAARDTLGFDWWAQAMAAQGYAVLQVNFRGSDGLGRKHLEAGYGEWGRKMQTDLSDGVRWVVGQGMADAKRVCIVGASYGGYAALAGATLDPGVYRCAVSVSGISDPGRFIAWSKDEHGRLSQKYWSRFMGVDGARDPDLAAISPIAHIDRIAGPVLLVHGKDDTVVPYAQSQMMLDAMRRAGKPVEMVTLKGEDHWMSRGDTRFQMLSAVIAFLRKNNPPA